MESSEDLNDHYPTTDVGLLRKLILDSDKLHGEVRAGNTIAYVVKGNKFIGKRIFTLSDDDSDQVDFMYATSIAINFNCMSSLCQWWEQNRNWKDGGYFVHGKKKT